MWTALNESNQQKMAIGAFTAMLSKTTIHKGQRKPFKSPHRMKTTENNGTKKEKMTEQKKKIVLILSLSFFRSQYLNPRKYFAYNRKSFLYWKILLLLSFENIFQGK